jgi:predicted O-methyltransferase YrrM
MKAAQGLNTLAKEYDGNSEPARAEQLYTMAAELELASPELQDCWGGPLNGQVGRQALFLDLLERIRPASILETGTFRGITTQWFAENFKGPIRTCEKERMFALEATARLSKSQNVDLHVADSRQFLQIVLSQHNEHDSLFIYLDAHWEEDLPLGEELRLIFAKHPKSIIAIDDFQVPTDLGYRWDDYGPGKSLDLDYLKGCIPDTAQIFFPTLPSSNETGAVRGLCVLATELSEKLTGCSLLRGASLGEWQQQFRHSSVSNLRQRLRASEEPLEVMRGELDARLEQIHKLTAKSEVMRGELDARLEQIYKLTTLVHNLEAEAQELETKNKLFEAESADRTKQIMILDETLTFVQTESNNRANQVNALKREKEELLAHSRKLISLESLVASDEAIPGAPRSLRVVLPLARLLHKVAVAFRSRRR